MPQFYSPSTPRVQPSSEHVLFLTTNGTVTGFIIANATIVWTRSIPANHTNNTTATTTATTTTTTTTDNNNNWSPDMTQLL